MTPNGHWLDQPRSIKRLWRAFLVVLAIVVVAEWVIALHPHFSIDALFGFHAVYGFIACAGMILFAKGLGLLLKRRDTYYQEDGDA